MKQRIQNGIAVLLLLIGLAGLLEFFSVGGVEIAGVRQIVQADQITVACYKLHQYDDRTVCTLDESQKQQLQQLLVDTRFRRSPAGFVRFSDRQMYEIQIQFSEQEPPFSLHLIGGRVALGYQSVRWTPSQNLLGGLGAEAGRHFQSMTNGTGA